MAWKPHATSLQRPTVIRISWILLWRVVTLGAFSSFRNQKLKHGITPPPPQRKFANTNQKWRLCWSHSWTVKARFTWCHVASSSVSWSVYWSCVWPNLIASGDCQLLHDNDVAHSTLIVMFFCRKDGTSLFLVRSSFCRCFMSSSRPSKWNALMTFNHM